MEPSFLARLADPDVRSVLLCGCGGGFDFVHGLLLHAELVRLGKRVVIASHSFGDPDALEGDASVVFSEGGAVVKSVSARTRHAPEYAPEVHVCSYLDEQLPEHAPHRIHAANCRAFAAPVLTRLYRQLARENEIDAVVLVDGGSDALVVGDELGLGDPVEDAVSVQAVAALEEVPLRVLLCVGLGVDRLNGVADAASLRAVAELAAAGGFLGALAIERDSARHRFYRGAVEHVHARQSLRSAVASAVLAAIDGRFGPADSSAAGVGGHPDGAAFVWPVMAMIWGFDVPAVARRSLLGAWLRDAATPEECYAAVREGRRALGDRIRAQEHLPAPAAWPWEGFFDAP